LTDEATPKIHGEQLVSGTKSGNEMIFECPDCSLGSIAMMPVRGDKLKFNVIVVKELFGATGGFIVQLL
jgi:hypothetical protein